MVQPPEQKLPEHKLLGQLSVCKDGQAAELPVQFAGSVATAGGPFAQLGERHSKVFGRNTLAGH